MGKLKYLVVHCTDTPRGREVSSDDIRRWHTSPVAKGGRGWSRVGYSDMIHLDGSVENLVAYDEDDIVSPSELTNGASGYNSISRHVVYVGGKNYGDIEDVQIESLIEYCREFKKKHPYCTIVGHHDLNKSKNCPNFDLQKYVLSKI